MLSVPIRRFIAGVRLGEAVEEAVQILAPPQHQPADHQIEIRPDDIKGNCHFQREGWKDFSGFVSAKDDSNFSHTYHAFQLNDFIGSFDNDGPGSVGEDMERGLELIDRFAEKVDYFDGQRLEFSESEWGS